MREYTKENPGCYHRMLDYLSELTGLPIYIEKEKVVATDEQLRNKPNTNKYSKDFGKSKLKHRVHDICIVDKAGQRYEYQSPKIDTRNIDISYYIVKYKEGTEWPEGLVQPAGSYKDSLGNGWSEEVPMYKVKDSYFTLMYCSCL